MSVRLGPAAGRLVDVERSDFQREVAALIGGALSAGELSPDVRDEEPFLIGLVALARANPEYLEVLEADLVRWAPQLATTPHPDGLVELLSYAVHSLPLPGLIATVKSIRAGALAAGQVGRSWEWAHRCGRVLEAQAPTWPEREVFGSLGE